MNQPFLGQPLVVRAAAAPVRIGDAERDQAVSLLADHFAAGRLDRDELDERVDQAMQAKFATDLRPVFADLPGAEPAVGRPALNRTGPPPHAPLFLLAPLLLVAAVVIAIAVGAPWVLWAFFWMFMCSGFWGRRRFQHHAHTHRRLHE